MACYGAQAPDFSPRARRRPSASVLAPLSLGTADFTRREAPSSGEVRTDPGKGDERVALSASPDFGVRRGEVNDLLRDPAKHPRRLGVIPCELARQFPVPSPPARAIPDRELQAHATLMAGGYADMADDVGCESTTHLDRCLELFLLTWSEALRDDGLVRLPNRMLGVPVAEPGAECVQACEKEQDEHHADEKPGQADADHARPSAQQVGERNTLPIVFPPRRFRKRAGLGVPGPAATLTERRFGTPQPLRRSFRRRPSLPERITQWEGGGLAWYASLPGPAAFPPFG
jgi:hypothetical protein